MARRDRHSPKPTRAARRRAARSASNTANESTAEKEDPKPMTDFDNARHRFYDAVADRNATAARAALDDMRKAAADLEADLLGSDAARGIRQLELAVQDHPDTEKWWWESTE